MQSTTLRHAEGADGLMDEAAYLVGRDRGGRWLAVDTRGLRGGLFTTREAALCFAQSETGYRPGAVLFAAEPLSCWG